MRAIKILIYTLSPGKVPKEDDEQSRHPGVTVVHGDIFACKQADCLVTAGNSFGMMDGGIDGLVNYQFGMIEGRVQGEIMRGQWRGELPVGAAIVLPVVPTMHLAFTHLCYAPTMRTPRPVAKTANAYLAARAALVACSAFPEIRVIAMPLLCHGVGGMDAADVILQVRHAWDTFHQPTERDWSAINYDEAILSDR